MNSKSYMESGPEGLGVEKIRQTLSRHFDVWGDGGPTAEDICIEVIQKLFEDAKL